MRPVALAAALVVGLALVIGAVAVAAAASTGRFTVGTAAIIAVYLAWPFLLILVTVLLMAAFVLLATAFFQKLRRPARR